MWLHSKSKFLTNINNWNMFFFRAKMILKAIFLLILVCSTTVASPKEGKKSKNLRKFCLLIYSQTWANDQLRIAITCLYNDHHFGSLSELLLLKWPLNNDHISTTATIFWFRWWLFYTGLTVCVSPIKSIKSNTYFYVTQKIQIISLLLLDCSWFCYFFR